MTFDYFYNAPTSAVLFYRLPRAFFTTPPYRDLSLGAKTVYMFLLDRLEDTTDSDNRRDERGKVYIVFPVDEVSERLKVSKKTACKYMAELDAKNGVGLIERVRVGLGHADRIYVLVNLLNEHKAPCT